MDIIEKLPLTKENVENTLKELGATDFTYPEEPWMYFRINSRHYALFTAAPPVVKLMAGGQLSEEYDLELAKKTAENINKDSIGLYIQVEDDRSMAIVAFSTAVTCYTLQEILPPMSAYLDEAYLQFLNHYSAAISASKKPKSKKIVS